MHRPHSGQRDPDVVLIVASVCWAHTDRRLQPSLRVVLADTAASAVLSFENSRRSVDRIVEGFVLVGSLDIALATYSADIPAVFSFGLAVDYSGCTDNFARVVAFAVHLDWAFHSHTLPQHMALATHLYLMSDSWFEQGQSLELAIAYVVVTETRPFVAHDSGLLECCSQCYH